MKKIRLLEFFKITKTLGLLYQMIKTLVQMYSYQKKIWEKQETTIKY